MTVTSSGFDQLRRIVYDRSAIVLGAEKRYLVESRLGGLASELGFTSVDELLIRLASREDPGLVARVVDAMTTNETSFLRDKHPFDTLCDEVLPAIVDARQGLRSLNIWSAACSTGQEPYTLAMLLTDRFPQLADWSVRILATDLSPRVLDQARAGRYSQLEVNRGLPARMMLKHMRRDGADWVVKPMLRERIQFRQLNLVERWCGIPKMDVVFLRNVLIYFDTPTKGRVLEAVRERMADDGVLFLGAAETTFGVTDVFERQSHGKTSCYRPAR